MAEVTFFDTVGRKIKIEATDVAEVATGSGNVTLLVLRAHAALPSALRYIQGRRQVVIDHLRRGGWKGNGERHG